MPAVVSMLRAVNVGGHNKVRMEALRSLYESLGLREVETFIQSGNVIFLTEKRDLKRLAATIADGIEHSFAFRPEVILRTAADLRAVLASNPFAARPGLDPTKLLVAFLSREPDREALEKVLGIKADPEELRIEGRELFVYFPNGMARPKLSLALIERTLKTPATGRNWNTVGKLLDIAERLEAPPPARP